MERKSARLFARGPNSSAQLARNAPAFHLRRKSYMMSKPGERRSFASNREYREAARLRERKRERFSRRASVSLRAPHRQAAKPCLSFDFRFATRQRATIETIERAGEVGGGEGERARSSVSRGKHSREGNCARAGEIIIPHDSAANQLPAR